MIKDLKLKYLKILKHNSLTKQTILLDCIRRNALFNIKNYQKLFVILNYARSTNIIFQFILIKNKAI